MNRFLNFEPPMLLLMLLFATRVGATDYSVATTGSEYGFHLGCEPANDSSHGNILRYNIAYDNTEYGLGIGGYTGGDVHDCKIYNNVFVNNKCEIGFSRNAGHDNLVVNNILYNPTGQSINYLSQPRDTVIDFNCYFVRYGDRPGKNSIITDPLFIDLAKRNFRLNKKSLCIDAGHLLKGLQKDFSGVDVPAMVTNEKEPRLDIGAFEYHEAVKPD